MFASDYWNIMTLLYITVKQTQPGHPTFFSQSQDKLRPKELGFVHQQLNLTLTLIGPLMKVVQLFCCELVLWLAKKTLGGPGWVPFIVIKTSLYNYFVLF